ncbi:putative lysosomal alpha-mannosidase (mannosidase alpha class 2b member 1) [Schistosoma mansoni]|uniref:putative lysosomal alpha-mannosidase (mannosidase alpha class 2b member 1) n=1 Tax=Schistosoma mansoni TaxID=6183 RepID=UPI00022DCC9B|nr:putative lysosomal alpha-mannosidase (mannosidase alpha class 2b member 1) [Schistosoma mansoni]|eukprot:XP_018655617.1 putative lysosomal alpha-mannosidase (mannosidase alpha class 2b member 1) [Schistosoma mansoni]
MIKLTTILLILVVYTNQCDSVSFRDLLKYSSSSKCGYDSCETGKSGYLNIHLIPHTHDDVGWLKTVDQYYYGVNNTIQRASVQYILDSVVSALAHNPNRKFTYVEMAYFYQWWIVQTKEIKHLVKDLVKSGQLQFALGGWSMADEATVYYVDAIDQLTYGNNLLKQLFSDCGRPLVAWQIDPFGHSRDHSNLFQDVGYDAVYFQRIDYREKEKRKHLKELEILWDTTYTTTTTTSNTTDNDKFYGLFTGMFYDTYCYPPNFEFDASYPDHSIVDNPSIQEYNVDIVVKKFIQYVKNLSNSFKTNHIMVLMGCDFTYENAHMNYNNMDKLIKYVNDQQKYDSNVNVLYSTPACYTKAVNEEFNRIGTINHRSGDFFPYASGSLSYWTGYYTSRPALKYYIRQASNLLSMCEQIHLFANHIPNKNNPYDNEENINHLRQVLHIVQHHDAVTGTSKQHVTNDYALRLYNGTKSCQHLINNSYMKLLPSHQFNITNQFDVTFCDLLNISLCNTTEYYQSYLHGSKNNHNEDDDNEDGDGIFILLYNPLGWEQSNVWIRFPIYIPINNDDYDNVDSLTNKFHIIIKDLRNSSKTHQSLPYQLNVINKRTLQIPERKSSLHHANYELLFNPKNLLPISFNSWNIDEAYIEYSSWASLIVRLYHNGELEVEWTIGPFPSDMIGRETVVRYTINGDDVQYRDTDSSGRRLIKRLRNRRDDWGIPMKYHEEQNITGNYYPIVNRIMIKNILLKWLNKKIPFGLAIYTDRSQGGTSLNDGQLELMLHRQTINDDNLGVNEPLEELGLDNKGLIVRGTHKIRFDELNLIESEDRKTAQEMRRPIIPMFIRANKQSLADLFNGWSGITKCLPNNINLLSLTSWPLYVVDKPESKNQILVRFENLHTLDNLKHTHIDASHLFYGITITDVTEMTLTADRLKEEAMSQRLHWPTEPTFQSVTKNYEMNSSSVILKIPPDKIITYILTYKIDDSSYFPD